MLERRKYIRLRDSLKIGYKVIGQSDITSEQFTENISGIGISFPLRHRINPGSIVELSLQIPGLSKMITATGEVVWLNHRQDALYPFILGLKFKKFDKSDQENIKKYIQSCLAGKGFSEIEWIG